jgi:hypothetical protein
MIGINNQMKIKWKTTITRNLSNSKDLQAEGTSNKQLPLNHIKIPRLKVKDHRLALCNQTQIK